MDKAVVYIGVDVAKAKLDVMLPNKSDVGTVANDKNGIASIIRSARGSGATVCCEATGGYETALVMACLRADVPVVRLDPWKVRHFAKALGKIEKTDRIDAEVIRRYAESVRPEPLARSETALFEIRSLWRLRDSLKRQIAANRTMLEHTLGMDETKTIEKVVRFLSKRVEELEGKCAALLDGVAGLKKKVERFQLVSGIGRNTAVGMCVLVPELGTLTDKAAAKLVGVAPLPNESGAWKGTRTIQRGRFDARLSIYMAAVVASRSNHVLAPFYRGLVARGKPPKVALSAVMRKLVVLLNRIARDPSFKPAQPERLSTRQKYKLKAITGKQD